MNQITKWDKKEIIHAIDSINGHGFAMIYNFVECIIRSIDSPHSLYNSR